MFYSEKVYGHERGLSCCFRQWRARSHCSQLHGYALQVGLVFEAQTLDRNNWVFDFGGLKDVKAWLDRCFDHTTIVAEDDPALHALRDLEEWSAVNIRLVENVGCEAFAHLIGAHVQAWLDRNDPTFRVGLTRCRVSEHAGNHAAWEPHKFAGTRVVEVPPTVKLANGKELSIGELHN